MIYDDDHYYLGSVMALGLRKKGHAVTLITPAGRPCDWGQYTTEVYSSNAALVEAGVQIITNQTLIAAEMGQARLACVFSTQETTLPCQAIIPLTRRLPVNDVYEALNSRSDDCKVSGIRSVKRIGDAEAPGIVAAAVHSGYRAAMDLGQDVDLAKVYGKREHPV